MERAKGLVVGGLHGEDKGVVFATTTELIELYLDCRINPQVRYLHVYINKTALGSDLRASFRGCCPVQVLGERCC